MFKEAKQATIFCVATGVVLMGIAAIADIHGNLPALESVLEDCEDKGIDQYIFLGDYITDGPFSKEELDVIRSMDAIMDNGNRENRILKLESIQTGKKVLAAAYWTRDRLREDLLQYIEMLKGEVQYVRWMLFKSKKRELGAINELVEYSKI